MVRNIVIILILIVVGVPSWQIGAIMLEKKQVGYLLQEHANSMKKYQNDEVVTGRLRKELELRQLAPEFKFTRTEPRKAKIVYTYRAAASVFGHTYYEVAEDMEAETKEGAFDN